MECVLNFVTIKFKKIRQKKGFVNIKCIDIHQLYALQ